MEKVVANFDIVHGCIKPMHAVNNGPIRAGQDQLKENFYNYKAAGIPYARNHDATATMAYGGNHTVDIHAIFPNFDADVNNPASYDFVCTDKYIKDIFEAGAKVFYRLGSGIEHEVKKYNTLPPKDFQKWAEICEHIIRHYTEGWADGFYWDIKYWEIWNEPDLDPDDSPNKRTWGGTKAQFFNLYEITAKHLKAQFPHLKIGGPAIAWDEKWAAEFLIEMRRRNVPIDFFSWHIYCTEVVWVIQKAERIRKMLDDNGYHEAESILNEWNYVKGWGKQWIYSIEQIIGMRGAAFVASCMLASQKSSIDMLMYYDAQPCSMNGMFDFYTLRPLKGYYTFKMFNTLYCLGTEVRCDVEGDNLYAVAAKGEHGETAMMLTYYTDEETENKVVHVILSGGAEEYELYLLDESHNGEKIRNVGREFDIELSHLSVVLVKEKTSEV